MSPIIMNKKRKIIFEMKRWIFIVLGIWIAVTAIELQGKSYYNTASNNFGGLFPHPGMRMAGRYKAIEEDRLIEENATMATAITRDTMHIHAINYRYQLRLANLHNKQGKTMSIKNPMTGSKTDLTSTEWGLVFNVDEHGDYCAVVLSCDNSAPYDDITDQRLMTIKVIRHTEGNTTILGQTTMGKGVSLEDDLNTVCVDVDEHGAHVSIGKEELHQVMDVEVARPAGPVRVGYLVGAGALVSLERAVLTIEHDKQVSPAATWTVDALNEHFAQSADPIEGYWKYLDRDMQDEWLRLGGRYTLAVVSTADGYDLIYIDGAQVKKSMWQAGMTKGHMTKTVFSGNYDLTWTDATMEPIGEDAYATVENGVILSLFFPEYKSQVRFAKVMNLDD